MRLSILGHEIAPTVPSVDLAILEDHRAAGDSTTEPVNAQMAVGVPQSEHYKGVLGIGGTILNTTPWDTLEKIVKAMPFLDVGLRKFVRMCGGFSVESEVESTQEEVNRWLNEELFVDWTQFGISSFHNRHARTMMHFGQALGEIVLTATGRDIHSVVNVPPRSVRIRFNEETAQIEFGQKVAFGNIRWFEHPEFLLYDINNPEGDSVHGTSMFRSAPWLSNTILTMENATRQLWQRQGAPPQFIHIKLPVTPDGSVVDKNKAAEIESRVRSEWKKAAVDRYQQTGLRDFTMASNCELELKTVGADLTQLDFQVPFRAFMEQVVSTIELPPWMLGISWSTTERLSDSQADGIVQVLGDCRNELEPSYLRIARHYQTLRGLGGELTAVWRPVTLQDAVEQERAAFLEMQSAFQRHAVAVERWRQGFTDQEAAGRFSLDDPAVTLSEIHDAPQQAASPIGNGQADAGTLAAAGQYAFSADSDDHAHEQ